MQVLGARCVCMNAGPARSHGCVQLRAASCRLPWACTAVQFGIVRAETRPSLCLVLLGSVRCWLTVGRIQPRAGHVEQRSVPKRPCEHRVPRFSQETTVGAASGTVAKRSSCDHTCAGAPVPVGMCLRETAGVMTPLTLPRLRVSRPWELLCHQPWHRCRSRTYHRACCPWGTLVQPRSLVASPTPIY